MRLSQVFTVLFLVGVLALGATEGARRIKKKAKKERGAAVCRYKGRPSNVGECDTATNKMELTFDLKVAKRGAECQAQQVKLVDCDDTTYLKRKKDRKDRKKLKKRCKYERKGMAGECDPATNQMEVVRKLRPDQPAECPAERKKMRKCRKNRKPKGCQYEKQPWSDCNFETRTKERVLVKIGGDDRLCIPRKVVTKKCRKGCRFDKSEWSACGPDDKFKHRKLTPKAGFPDQCKPFTQTRPCGVLAELTGAKPYRCKYRTGPWSRCDPRTNTMTRVWILRSGDPNVCVRTKNFSRKCKTCKFLPGEWSECDEELGLMTRIDKLAKGNNRACDATREITKKCKKECKYNWGNWTECDPETNQRSRMGILVKGDAEKCESTSTMFKPCTTRNGEERCFFGPWEDFGPCLNGVMIKRRQVVQGGVACERKAAKTRACDDVSS